MARSNHRAFFCHKRRFISPNFWFSPKSPFLATFFPNSLAHLKNYYYLYTPNPPLSPQSGGFFYPYSFLFPFCLVLPRCFQCMLIGCSSYAHRMLIGCWSRHHWEMTSSSAYFFWRFCKEESAAFKRMPHFRFMFSNAFSPSWAVCPANAWGPRR